MFSSFNLVKLGEHLKNLRISLGYTQREVASIANIATDTLRRIEKGEVVPRYDTIVCLSHAYKRDLLNVLKSYSNANTFFDFYFRFENLVLLNDLSGINQLKSDLKNYMEDNNFMHNLVNNSAAEQFHLMLTGVQKYYASDYLGSFKDFRNAMQISHPTFNIKTFDQFRYTHFELRILFMIATSISRMKPQLGNDAFLFCLEQLDRSIYASLHEKLLRIKVHFHLSYNYHRTDNHEKAYHSASKGIAFCNEIYSSYCLGALLYRKGIAQLHLDDPSFLNSLQQAINILYIQGADELALRYRDITYKVYGICLK